MNPFAYKISVIFGPKLLAVLPSDRYPVSVIYVGSDIREKPCNPVGKFGSHPTKERAMRGYCSVPRHRDQVRE